MTKWTKQPSAVDPKKHNTNTYRTGTLRDLYVSRCAESLFLDSDSASVSGLKSPAPTSFKII